MKVVIQDGAKDCGAACLLSIIRYYKGDISIEKLREMTSTTKDGVTALNLINVAKELGFDSYGLKGEIDNIDKSMLPLIAHTNNNKIKHFIVIYEMIEEKDKIIIMNPECGRQVISYSELSLMSTHYFIYLKPISKIPIYKYDKVINKNIKSFIKINKELIIIITILTIIYLVLNILSSFHIKYLINYSINYNNTNNIKIISYFIFIVFLYKNICYLFRNIISLKLLSIFDNNLSSKVFNQILLLPFSYYKNRTTGEILNRIKDLSLIRDYYTNLITFTLTDILSIIVFFIFMVSINKKITIYILIYSIIILTIYLITKSIFKEEYLNLKKDEDIVNTKLIEGINNSLTIKNNHIEKRIIDEYKIKYKNLINTNYKYIKHKYTYNTFIEVLNNLLLVIIYLYGSIYVILNKLTIIELLLIQTFFNYYNNSFNRIINFINNYDSYNISKKRIDDLFNIKQESFKDHYYYEPYNLKGIIKITNLTYKIGIKELFTNLNLTINPKEKILITGKSGCGKSTLMKILMRYILIPYNIVSIDNIDINHYHLESIRNNITYISNYEYLFNDTLLNNITLYKKYDDNEIDKVINLVLVNEISTDKDKIIEEDGFNFSSGERQRIVLARSLLRNTNIYIFDEALNQIDIYREKKILKNIFDYYKDKTIIVISHRNNNKSLFDRCLVLEDGKIYEK